MIHLNIIFSDGYGGLMAQIGEPSMPFLIDADDLIDIAGTPKDWESRAMCPWGEDAPIKKIMLHRSSGIGSDWSGRVMYTSSNSSSTSWWEVNPHINAEYVVRTGRIYD